MNAKNDIHFKNVFLFSGKKGSGKDTIAPLVMSGLGIPADSVQYMYFADPLKETLDEVIQALRGSASVDEAHMNLLDVESDMPLWVRQSLIELLYERSREVPDEHARSHSAPVVAALQLYGTDFRRGQDPDYWARKAADSARVALEAGKVPCFMDARFPNEIDVMRELDAISIRLNVSAEEQWRRLSSRDDRVPNQAELTHKSEVALDDYQNFTVMVDTDGGVDSTIAAVLKGLR